MKQKDIERVMEAAWELVRNPAKRHVWQLKIAKILEEIDPHGVYRLGVDTVPPPEADEPSLHESPRMLRPTRTEWPPGTPRAPRFPKLV